MSASRDVVGFVVREMMAVEQEAFPSHEQRIAKLEAANAHLTDLVETLAWAVATSAPTPNAPEDRTDPRP